MRVRLKFLRALRDIRSYLIATSARLTESNIRFASDTKDRRLMTRVTTFLVQTFDNSKGAPLKPDAPVSCRSLEGARRTAERLSLSHMGVVAFSVTSDPETGDYDDQPTIFYRAGQLPAEFDGMP